MIHSHEKGDGYVPFQSMETVKTKDITVNKRNFSSLCPEDMQYARSLQHYAGHKVSVLHVM